MNPRRRALLATLLAGSHVSGSNAESTLNARSIPSSGEALPVIGLGTWQGFDVGGDAGALATLGEVLQVFADGGGTLVDSSPMYGTSEAVFGGLQDQRKLQGRLFVATKVWTRGRDAGVQQMEASLRRMRVARMDLMQVHNLLDVEAHTKTLQDWKAKGRIRYAGITHYNSSAYAEVERWLKTRQYDFLQINYSLAELESDRRLLPLAQELGTAVIVNRPFAEGAMFRRAKGKPLPPWAAELGIASWAQFFLKWIAGHPAVTCIIPGTARPEHMLDNLAAGRGTLPDAAQRRRMAEHYAAL
jgi:aryl-alcohol dehydrogenase-like predicted oxidoreductase